MAKNTNIEWTDATVNFWWGCTKVGPGCDHCYAEKWSKRTGEHIWGTGVSRRKIKSAVALLRRLDNDYSWWGADHEIACHHVTSRGRVFIQSMSDLFDLEVPGEWFAEAWQTIESCVRLHIQIVTKRISAVEKRLATIGVTTWPQHAGLMITVCNQTEADRDIPRLLELKTRLGIPWVGLSIEPLLGPVDLNNLNINGDYTMDALNPLSWRELWDIHWSPEATGTPLDEAIESYVEGGGVYPPTDERAARLDWVIVGGESGSRARPMHPDWARSLRDQCAAADVPFFFKQWGEWAARDEWPRGLAKAASSIAIDARGNEVPDDIVPHDIGGQIFEKTGKARAGRRLDGFEHNDMPRALCAEARSCR